MEMGRLRGGKPAKHLLCPFKADGVHADRLALAVENEVLQDNMHIIGPALWFAQRVCRRRVPV